ncbi:hypothetical protein [Streptomyces sp. 6N106]|uniref:hypothetical protein n=1 Tax=Streptomyces sp. 6N106 TaxID=3457418 RepID=UPI003FD3B6E0
MTDETTQWNARTRLALAARSVDTTTADTVLDEVAQHCADSGETPYEAFGTPDEYADTVISERIPPEARAGLHADGLTRADHLSSALAQTGVVTLIAGVFLWGGSGTMLSVTPAGLTGSALTAVALISACLALTFSGSRLRAAAAWGLTALVAVMLAAVAFTTLPITRLGRLPTPALCMLGVVLLWSATRSGPVSHHEGVTMTRQTDAHSRDEDWLRELHQLLRQRHAISHDRAAELTRDAAHHLIATGGAPQDEFGPVELYALKLAEQERSGSRWWLRQDVQAVIVVLITLGYLVSNLLSDGPLWQTIVASAALAGSLASLVFDLRRKRPIRSSR